MGYPPCTHFSQIQALNWGKGEARNRFMSQRYEEGVGHLQCVVNLCLFQMSEGRYFIHEHLWSASSWHVPFVRNLMDLKGVLEVRVDQCSYGLTSADKLGAGLALKSTRFITNTTLLARCMEKRCANLLREMSYHRHVQLMCGRAMDAAIYPQRMCEAIVHGLSQQNEADRTGVVPVA